MRAPRPDPRQRVVAAALLRAASHRTLAVAYLQGAFTWRQAAAAIRRGGPCAVSRARYLNRHAVLAPTSPAVPLLALRVARASAVCGVRDPVLAEPARAFWVRCRGAFDRVAAVVGGRSRVVLGGDAVLAARWGRRRPGRLTVLYPERDALNDALPGGAVDLAAAVGGSVVQRSAGRLRLRIPSLVVDVVAAPLLLPGLERRRLVAGRSEWVLDNAQLRLGALLRTDVVCVSGAADLAAGAAADPRAFGLAVNALSCRARCRARSRARRSRPGRGFLRCVVSRVA